MMRMTKKTKMIPDRCYCPKHQGSNMIEKNEEKTLRCETVHEGVQDGY
jgi:hypothetical protein